MNRSEAASLARSLMNEHDLGDWVFGFDHAKRRFGCCWHGERKITLSEHLTKLNPEADVRNTILHEIAHALAGPYAKHGPGWRTQCAVVGIKPDRCYDAEAVAAPEQIPPRWVLTCPRCEKKAYRRFRFKSAADLACKECCQERNYGRWDARFQFVWTTNPAFIEAGGKL